MSGFEWLLVWSAVIVVSCITISLMFDNSFPGEAFGIGLLCGLFVSGIIVGLGWSGYFLPRQRCEERADALKREHQWSFAVGCLIEDGARFVPLENWFRNEESSR